jgi:type I restriction enzyme M protein
MSKNKKEFLGLTKALQKISNRHNFSNVFDDFMTMAICAYSFGKMEDLYVKTISKYSADEIPLFGQALGEMINEYDNNMNDEGDWKDILGKVFEETNSSFTASNNGQFFTPHSLCNLMANLICSKEACEENIYVNDCSSGSGRNLIAHSRLHPLNRFRAFYVAQDLDERCVNMSVLNFVMFGLKGIVIHMNTLSMEIFKGYRIYLADTMMGIKPLTVDECKRFIITEKAEEPNIINVTNNKQLSLF